MFEGVFEKYFTKLENDEWEKSMKYHFYEPQMGEMS